MLIVAEEAHKTDTGRQRHANEDSYFARSPLFAAADGVGGAQGGGGASRIAAGAFERRGQVSADEPAEGQLEQIAQAANRENPQPGPPRPPPPPPGGRRPRPART